MSPALRRRLSRPGVLRKINPVTGFMESIDQKTGETLHVDESQEYALNEGTMWGADEMGSVDYSTLGGGGGRGIARVDDRVIRAQEKALKEKYPGTNLVFNSRKMRWEDPVAEAAYEAKLDKYIQDKRKLQAEIQKKKNASKPRSRKVWTPFGYKYIPIVSEAYASISNEIGNLQEAIKNLEVPTMPTYDDIVSQIPTMDEISEKISESTPDIKIVEEDIITADEVLTKIDETGGAAGEFVKGGVKDALKAGETVTDTLGEVYEGSDVDTFLEDSKDMADLMLDTVITIATGEDHGKVKELKEGLQETQQDYQDLGDDFQTGLDNLQDITTDTITTTNQVIGEIGTNAAETVVDAADDVIDAFVDAGILTRETKGGAVTEGSRGGDVVRDEDLIQLLVIMVIILN